MCQNPQGLNLHLYAAFLWKRLDESAFPVTAATTAPKVDESQDVRAALEAAGGGRGAEIAEP